MMPWGWRHAYLNDPDGHEISLYWAGGNRMKKTMMKAAQKSIEYRLAHGGGHTGWSRAWIINFWARFRNGEKAH